MSIASNPVIYMTRTMWKYSKGNRHKVSFFVFLFTCANLINFFEPLIIGKILNIIQESGLTQESMVSIVFFLFLFLLLDVGFWIFHGPARVLERKNSFIVRANYKKYLLDGTMDLPPEWHTDHHSGDTIDKIEKSTRALYKYSQDTFLIIETIIRFTASYCALVYFNLHSSYIVALMVIITLTIILRFDKVLVKQYRILNRAENTISAKIFDVISNITTVIILRVENLVSRSIFRKIMSPFRLFIYNQKVNETKWFLVSMCTSVMTFLVLFFYIYPAFKNNVPIMIGSVYILYGYVDRINNLFFRFAYKYGEIVRQKAKVMNVQDVCDEFREKKKEKSLLKNKKWKRLKIENLNFSYYTEDRGMLHLENINMIIKKNQKIALMGASGSGKTTLLSVIRNLYHPNQLQLFLDKKPLTGGFEDISEDIALIPQDPEIFSTTIKENITIGVSHKLSDIKKFTNIARFTKVAEALPKKFNSSIVEKGVNLSGGEKQRLALARGLMACKDKSIVLFDEPTSSVDLKNEYEIFKNIFKKFKRKTIISSIHRLHLLPLFDKIYFFKDGKIIASGSFRKLLKTSLEFKKLWKSYKRKG